MGFTPEQIKGRIKSVAKQNNADARTLMRIYILVRESGTEPVIRVMVEAPDHDSCQKYVDEVVNVICKKGYKA